MIRYLFVGGARVKELHSALTENLTFCRSPPDLKPEKHLAFPSCSGFCVAASAVYVFFPGFPYVFLVFLVRGSLFWLFLVFRAEPEDMHTLNKSSPLVIVMETPSLCEAHTIDGNN